MGKFIAIGAAVLTALLAVTAPSLVENLNAGEYMVIQSLSGKLTTYTEPGWKVQGYGKATHYDKSFQFSFSSQPDVGKGEIEDQSIKIRFNDGGHAQASGSVRVDIPGDPEHLLDIHRTYGSQMAVEQSLIRTVIEKSVYMTGPLMSSTQSYAEKRNELLNYIADQASNGVYRTQPVNTTIDDPVSGKKNITVTEIVREDGKLAREEESPLIRFGVKLYNLSLNEIKYDDIVEKQIQARQNADGQVQVAMANAKKAEQDAITVELQGKASAAQAKWDQEVEKAKFVTKAEQELEVAKLEKLAAEQGKQKAILEGQGQAEKMRLTMAANGALDQKLVAYVDTQKAWADAFARREGNIVPEIQMGGNTGGAGNNGLNQMMEFLAAKAAKDLQLDLKVAK